jgi:hypothetical protein
VGSRGAMGGGRCVYMYNCFLFFWALGKEERGL